MNMEDASLDLAELKGRVEPRLYTEPLRELTPETSYGFAVIDFARDVLEEPLDPWQQWAVIHAGELLPDGRPRFKQVLILVARQQGKTHLLKVLGLYWLFVEKQRLVLGLSSTIAAAKESWQMAVDDAEFNDHLKPYVSKVTYSNGEQALWTSDGCRYKIAATTRRGARGLSVDRLIVDELREQHSWDGYNAAIHTLSARPNGQAILISNAGDQNSVVLNSLRQSALDGADQRLGIFEWSAPDFCELDDIEALRQANPNVGHRTHWDDLLGPARRAKLAGGQEEASFRTEVLCQYVKLLDPAVNPASWQHCLSVGSLEAVRDRLALCLDVSHDGNHATLVAAAVLPDGRVRIEVVKSWEGVNAIDQCRRDLFGLVPKVAPRVFGWLPNGPAASMAADLQKKTTGRVVWPPKGVQLHEIRGELGAVCMGFAEQVIAENIVHSGDPLLDAHVGGAQKRRRGDTWVFERKSGHCDAAYAAAGAVHLARLIPIRSGSLELVAA